MRFLLALLTIAAGLGIAWVSDWVKPDAIASQPIAVQRIDADRASYRRIYFEAAVLRAGERLAEGHDAYVKAFALDGKLALCGFAEVREAGYIGRRARAWLDSGKLEIAGRRIASKFIVLQQSDSGEAGCTLTELPWREDYRTASLKLTGLPLLDAP